MTEKQMCAVCHQFVSDGEAATHLASAHPVGEGVLFYYEGRPYYATVPSMRVSELLAMTGGSALYQFHEDRDGQQFLFSQSQSVSLMDGPRRFYSVPPATF